MFNECNSTVRVFLGLFCIFACLLSIFKSSILVQRGKFLQGQYRYHSRPGGEHVEKEHIVTFSERSAIVSIAQNLTFPGAIMMLCNRMKCLHSSFKIEQASTSLNHGQKSNAYISLGNKLCDMPVA